MIGVKYQADAWSYYSNYNLYYNNFMVGVTS